MAAAYKRGLQQPQIGPDLHGGGGMLMFWSHEPVAPWQDEAWLSDMRRSPGMSLEQYERITRPVSLGVPENLPEGVRDAFARARLDALQRRGLP